MHSNNRFKQAYPLDELCRVLPALTQYIIKTPKGDDSVNFADPAGVKALNKALLHYYYGVGHWDIPPHYLCPPVPGRADYIHHIADLLKDTRPASSTPVRGLDIGTGANVIYPIIAQAEYGWHMLGSDIDKTSIDNAKTIIKLNPKLSQHIQVKQQRDPNAMFAGVVNPEDRFDFCMCNPPFHDSAKAADVSTASKTQNLKQSRFSQRPPAGKQHSGPDGKAGYADKAGKVDKAVKRNFAGQSNELWCHGGEIGFISKMIRESVHYKDQFTWFTSLISKKDSVYPLQKRLKKVSAAEVKMVKMSQGHKMSRFIAWRF